MMEIMKGLTPWALVQLIKLTMDVTRIRQRVPDGGNRPPGEVHRMTGDLDPGQVQMEACRSPSA